MKIPSLLFSVLVAVLSNSSANAGLLGECELTRLPLGSVKPEGWLKFQLDKMTDGICGRLYEYGEYLNPSNGWISVSESGELDISRHWREHTGWEEQPYWFRSFVKLAALTGNERLLGVARDWTEKILRTAEPDGWYGPKPLKLVKLSDGAIMQDIWGHMVMNEALLSWYDYTRDERIIRLLSRFTDYCLAIPDDHFINPPGGGVTWAKTCGWLACIQQGRAGDMVSTLFRLYDATGEEKFVRLADKVWRRYYEKPDKLFLDPHNVNFCQRFSYPSIYARRNGDLALAEESEYWLTQHRLTWGEMPRCAFAADENCRSGCTDPRYGLESCSWGEYVRSFQNLADFRAETKWADRTEDVVFNHAPCAFTPDWNEVHYITACNQVVIDARTDHDYANHPPMNAYSHVGYRCCLYNASMALPLFAENLVKRAKDGALVFWMYAPCSGKADGLEWKLETRYPFRESATLKVVAAKPATLRFRVPRWAKAFSVEGGASGSVKLSADAAGGFCETRVAAGATVLTLAMKAECVFTPWPRQNGLSVDRGPLTYSVAIGEKYSHVSVRKDAGGSTIWTEAPAAAHGADVFTEIAPTSAWNYGIDITAKPVWRECAWNDDCFTASNACCEIAVRCRRLPEWTLQDNEPARLQLSPAYSAAPLETVRFTPLGCQRLRLSVLPQVTDDDSIGYRWRKPPAVTERKNRAPIFRHWEFKD